MDWKGIAKELWVRPLFDLVKLEEQQHLFHVTIVHNAESACDMLVG